MASPEHQSAAPEKPQNIPGFKGLERLDTTDALKKGAFREFLNKVIAIRQNPEEQKKISDALAKIDNNPILSDEQKKEQLRSQPQAELLATIGKNIELGEKGMSITLDFGKLAFAEQKAIGAGHLLPPNTGKIAFNGESNPAEKRQPGSHGGEYRSEKGTYMSSFTGTKLFIKYEDILPFDAKQMEQATALEKASVKKVQTLQDSSHDAQTSLRREVAGTSQPTQPAQLAQREQSDEQFAESKEKLVSHRPVFIGDSQVEGLRPSLAKRGIKAFDYRGLRMETIATRINTLSEDEKQFIRTADTIVLQCGGNNLAMSKNYPLEKMQNNFQKLINAVKEINPNVHIRVGTLMAPGDNSSSRETRFAWNAWLKNEATKSGGFSVVDTYALTEDPGNPGHRIEALFGGANNPHLKMSEYAKLSPKLLEAINYKA